MTGTETLAFYIYMMMGGLVVGMAYVVFFVFPKW